MYLKFWPKSQEKQESVLIPVMCVRDITDKANKREKAKKEVLRK